MSQEMLRREGIPYTSIQRKRAYKVLNKLRNDAKYQDILCLDALPEDLHMDLDGEIKKVLPRGTTTPTSKSIGVRSLDRTLFFTLRYGRVSKAVEMPVPTSLRDVKLKLKFQCKNGRILINETEVLNIF